MEMMPDFSTDNVKKFMGDTLRLYVGHGRSTSWAYLAEATHNGEGPVQTWERRLRSYVDPAGNLPPLDIFMRIIAVLPPAAMQRVANFMGFSAGLLEVDGTASVRRAGAAAARFAANVAEALEDGHIDHNEMAALATGAIELGPLINTVAGGSAPH